MNKTLLSILAMVCCAVSPLQADDVADARKAFDFFVQYQKTDDEKMLDLFAPDISVTLTFDTGKETRDMVLPADTFREIVKGGLARKNGTKDAYEDVKCTQEGDTVKLTATLVDGKTGKKGPFVAVYAKDGSGNLTIKAMKVTLAVDKLPAGS